MAKHHDKANGIETSPKMTRKDHSLRSESPAVKFSPPRPDGRPKATPKRRLKNRKDRKAHEEVKESSHKLQDALANGPPSIADSIAEIEEADDDVAKTFAGIIADEKKIAEDAAGAMAAATADDVDELAAVDDTADGSTKVTVTSDTQEGRDIDATRTKVTIEMPANTENGSVPEKPDQALAAAKAIVQEAKALQDAQTDGASSPKQSKKRKAEELEVENPEEELVTELVQNENEEPEQEASANGESSSSAPAKQVQFGERTDEPPTKRTRVMVPADEFRRQKMQKRALIGLTTTVAVGWVHCVCSLLCNMNLTSHSAIIPFVSSLF